MLNILNVAQSGLKASQTQVENVMNNLANQTTEGYKTRVVNVSEIEQSDARLTGQGINVDDVSRATNIYMYQNLIKANSTLSNINQLNTMLADIESIFYETSDSGFSADLDRYFNSIENLRTSPQNEVYKNDVSSNAQVIVANLQNMYQNIENVEETTLLNIRENVGEINNILTEIGNISQKIVETTTGTANDLLDKRDLLEKQLAEYIDVEISRGEHYELKVAGVTAVRFDTNVHEITIIEDYTPQKDAYVNIVDGMDDTKIIGYDTDDDGVIDLETGGNPKDAVTDYTTSFPTFTGATPVAEIQEIVISGQATSNSIQFLGSTVTTTTGDSAADVAGKISADPNIITEWNRNNPDKQIASITNNAETIEITYQALSGDVPAIDNTSSKGMVFTGSVEKASEVNQGKGFAESMTYVLNNTLSITVTIGETIQDTNGVDVDFDKSGAPVGVVTADNIIQALVYQINQHKDIGGTVTAYNGKYEISESGTKISTDNPEHSKYIDPAITSTTSLVDRYLYIESTVGGEEGSFVGEVFTSQNKPRTDLPANPATDAYAVNKQNIAMNDNLSEEGINDIHLEIYDKEISLVGGSIKAMIDNVKTDSGANVFNEYKEKLDQFAKTLSNLTDSYIENADQSYVYGTDAVELHTNEDEKILLNLFSGADVKSLKFNTASLNTLTQNKLDYLATIQWKEDVDFDGTDLNNESFSSFYQTLRVSVADNKENAFFSQGAQAAVTESLQNAYDKVTKVDSDEEMVQLIKFQSAYEANAKMITLVDEMLQTILNM